MPTSLDNVHHKFSGNTSLRRIKSLNEGPFLRDYYDWDVFRLVLCILIESVFFYKWAIEYMFARNK